METWGRAAWNPMNMQCTYVSTDTICNSKSQKTGNLISVATLVVNGNLGEGCLQPNEYAMYNYVCLVLISIVPCTFASEGEVRKTKGKKKLRHDTM